MLTHLRAKLHEAQHGVRNADCVHTLCLYRAWLLARVSLWYPDDHDYLGSEARHMAQQWFPVRHIPMDQLVREDRSLRECALQVEAIAGCCYQVPGGS